jgi:Fe-S cluster biogenesis protein NfuA
VARAPAHRTSDPEIAVVNLLKPLRALFGGQAGEAPQPAAGRAAPAGNGGAQAAGATCEEVSLQHLWTDQSNALKFLVGATVLPAGEQRAYSSAAEAAEAPLVRALFEAPGIASVQLDANTITVLMGEDADWDELHKQVPAMIRKFFSAAGSPVTAAGSAASGGQRYRFGFRQVTGRPREEQLRIVQELFDKEVNPAVASHGGFFNLLDIQDNTVYVELGGGCQGCGMANVTLRQGVEARLREVLPEMAALVDQTDHASGTNPYYQASKK